MATKTFNVSFPDQLTKKLDRFAKKDGISRSEVLRDAARSYLDWWSDWNDVSKEMRVQAKQLDITTEEDVDRVVHEVRDEIAALKRQRTNR